MNLRVVYSIGARIAGGGIGNTSYFAAREIWRAGFLKRLLCTSHDSQKCEVDARLIKSVPFIDSYWSRIPVVRRLKNFYWVKDNLYDLLATRYIKSCDIFHGWAHFSLFQLRQAKKLGAKIVLDRASSHVLTQKRILETEYKKFGLGGTLINRFIKVKSLEEYREADLILVPSNFAYQSFLEQGVVQEKLRLVPFGVDLERFASRSTFRKASSSVSNSSIQFLFVGQIGIRKGIHHLLQAWDKLSLKNARLTLLGSSDETGELIKSKYRHLRSVEFAGFQDPHAYYQGSDVFVFPSLEEGSALVTYEAMAAGLPQIVTFESGSLVEDGQEGLLVKSADVNALAEKIKYLYENTSAREKMSINARTKIADYPWESYGQRIVKVYREL